MKYKRTTVVLEDMPEQKKIKYHLTFPKIFLCLMMIFGNLLIMRPFIAEAGAFFVLILVTVCFSIFLIAFQNNEAMYRFICVLLLLFCVLLLCFRMGEILRGILSIVNEIIQRWNTCFHDYKKLYAVSNVQRMDYLLVSVWIGILLSVFFGYTIWKRWTLVLTVYVVFLCFVTFYFQLEQSFFSVTCIFAGWIGIWTNDTVRNQKYMGSSLLLCVLTVFLTFGISGILGTYDKNEDVYSLKEGIKQTIHEVRYGKDALPKGNLKKADLLLAEGEKKNTLFLQYDIISELHLKGFVGANYDGTSWTTLENADYTGKQDGMLEWLKKNKFDTIFEYAFFRKLNEKYGIAQYTIENVRDGSERGNVTVTNNGADRMYVYVPETVISVKNKGYQSCQDWQLRATGFTGAKTYDFEAYMNVTPTELLKQPDWMTQVPEEEEKNYELAENVYRTFAYQYYTDITTEQKQWIHDIFFSGKSWTQLGEDQRGIYAATSRIRTVLNIVADYEEHPETVPKKEDFVRWFLEKYKKGNSVHYASAAVLAYRDLGIPARYVEGYLVDEQLAADLNQKGKKQVQLTEENGHAWVEIYVDGIGWCPVEVTPGFYSEVFSAEKIIDVPEEEVEGNADNKKVDVAEKYSDEKQKKKEAEKLAPIRIIGIILFVIFCALFLLFLFEVQRWIRIYCRKEAWKKWNSLEKTQYLYREICRIFFCAGIRKNYNFPYQLTEEVTECFPTVKREEFERVVQIVQKVTFSEVSLKKNEERILILFIQKRKKELYKKASVWKKIQFRYFHSI